MARRPNPPQSRGSHPRKRPSGAQPNPGAPIPRTPPADGRDAAIRHLARLASRYPDVVPLPVATDRLDSREASLAHAIVDHAVRRWLTIEHLIRVCALREPAELEPRVRAALLSGAVQLLFLDRIPTHAAIDQTVEWAKRNVREGAAGITNAILRRIASARAPAPESQRLLRDRATGLRDELPLADGRALALIAPVLPEDPISRVALASGIPEPLVSRWTAAFGPDRAAIVALHGLLDAPTIINAGTSTPPLSDLLPHRVPGFFVHGGSRDALSHALATNHSLWVQDTASAEAVASTTDLSPRVIADVCAGRGTKTRQLARLHPNAEIIASDTDPARMVDLRAVAARTPSIRVVEPRDLLAACAGRVDLILLDVPCSNTGVLARRPEARHRFGPEQFERLASVQRQIFADALRLLAPGAHVLYSTCSLEPEENDAMVRWAARWHRLRALRSALTLPQGVPGDPPTDYADGSYWALLRA